MILPLVASLVFCVPSFVVALLWWVGRFLLGRAARQGFWMRVLWAHLVLLVFHAFITFPLALGFVGSRWIDTRPDERGYEGPRILDDGTWQLQSRDTLASEVGSKERQHTKTRRAARQRAVQIESSVALRGFLVEAPQSPPRAMVLMVHGLFRNAMELEPVGAMFRRHGCEVLLLELRNHGGSGRAPATFGLHEADDVIAAAQFLRQRPERSEIPLLLFGVSLGTAAAALAAPRIPDLAGVMLDAPMDDLLSTAHRMHGRTRNGGRRIREVWEPWRSLVFRSLELWSDFSMATVRPGESLRSLPADIPVLLIGGSEDDRMPPDSVQRLYDALPMREGTKQLWIREGSGHGRVWKDAPVEYERYIGTWLVRST